MNDAQSNDARGELSQRQTRKRRRKSNSPPQEDEEEHSLSSASEDLENDPNKRAKVGDPYVEGKMIFKNEKVTVKAKSVSHKRFTRFSLQDHLYNIEILPNAKSPLVLNISMALKT